MKNLHEKLLQEGYKYDAIGIGNPEKNKSPYEALIVEGKISKYLFVKVEEVSEFLKVKGINIKQYSHAIYVKKSQ
ncbi:hypothetical protein ISS08_01110 [Candidatus Pacearchaeota archaeon]|nr:hypothetical protein [Candidatus Pacearchaeota archaeon]